MPPRQQTTEQYDIDSVDGIDELRDRMCQADDITDWSHILNDYIKFGNNKISDTVAVFNFNSATDCMNRNTEHCQVPDGLCYAFNDEEQYPAPLDYRRRQEYLWDSLDAMSWARAFLKIVDRKRNPVKGIRFSEAGDFRGRHDVIKVDWIAEILAEKDIICYTYSASDWVDWSDRQHFTLNASNDAIDDVADRRYFALPEGDDLPEGAVWCPFDLGEPGNRKKCGDCRICLEPEGPDVAIPVSK
jgi:hypothetical protein